MSLGLERGQAWTSRRLAEVLLLREIPQLERESKHFTEVLTF
jgi:hypothetical protein